MIYYTLKHVHVAAVLLSFVGFVLRGWWMLSVHPLRQHRLTRILPHLVDTVLLGSAVWMSVLISQFPFTASWLSAKFLGLLVYIGLGMVALRFGSTAFVRGAAWLSALLVYAWIVSVAIAKQPWGFLNV